MTAYGDMVENRTRYTEEEEHKNTQGECSYLIFSSLKDSLSGRPGHEVPVSWLCGRKVGFTCAFPVHRNRDRDSDRVASLSPHAP